MRRRSGDIETVGGRDGATSQGAGTVAPWLQPQERLLVTVGVSLNLLIRNRVPRRYRKKEPEQPEREVGLLLRLLGGILMGVVWACSMGGIIGESLSSCLLGTLRLMVLPIRGRPFRGGWRSQAGQFVIAVRTGPSYFRDFDNSMALMAITNRRLLLLHQGAKRGECLAEFPREQLRSLTDRSHWYSDRMDIHFADGSLVAVGIGESGRELLLSALNG